MSPVFKSLSSNHCDLALPPPYHSSCNAKAVHAPHVAKFKTISQSFVHLTSLLHMTLLLSSSSLDFTFLWFWTWHALCPACSSDDPFSVTLASSFLCSLQYRLSSFHFILFSQSITSNPMLSTATCELMIPNFYLLRPLWWLPETFIHPTVWDFCIWIYKGTSTNSTY